MVTSSIHIKANVQKIWDALTDKKLMKEWYFDIPDFELKEDAEFNFYEGDARKYHHRCVVKEILPLKKFSHTWTHPSHSKGESTVTWILNEEVDSETAVVLLHEGIENFADGGADFAPENYKMGWDALLTQLNSYLKGLKKHQYAIQINAPKEKVWEALWNAPNYTLWTSAFGEGGYFKGEIKEGSRIHFMNETQNGIFADIIFIKPHQYILFQHKGIVKAGNEMPENAESEKWSGAFESYTLQEENGLTNVKVEIETMAEYSDYFNDAFPKALTILKEISEK